MNAKQLRILAEIMAQQAQVLAMQADNQYRSVMGESPAYTGADFGHHASILEGLAQEALKSDGS